MAVTSKSPSVYFNPWDERYRANPYPHYEPLYYTPRIDGPVRPDGPGRALRRCHGNPARP
jgi:hypothetical protein